MKTVKDFLSGKKTYIVAFLMVLIGLVNFATGELSLVDFLQSPEVNTLLGGLAIGFLRAGISKVE